MRVSADLEVHHVTYRGAATCFVDIAHGDVAADHVSDLQVNQMRRMNRLTRLEQLLSDRPSR